MTERSKVVDVRLAGVSISHTVHVLIFQHIHLQVLQGKVSSEWQLSG